MFEKLCIHKHCVSTPQPAELFNIIYSLNPNKASGYDNISSYFLSLDAEILAAIPLRLFWTDSRIRHISTNIQNLKVILIL